MLQILITLERSLSFELK